MTARLSLKSEYAFVYTFVAKVGRLFTPQLVVKVYPEIDLSNVDFDYMIDQF